MANPGQWINFAELCRRWPGKSPRTLRRYIKARLISSRQTVRGGRVEFNWSTVAKELALMESQSAAAAHLAGMTPDYPPDLQKQIGEIQALLTLIAKQVGIPAEAAHLFAGEQSTAREVLAIDSNLYRARACADERKVG